MAVRPRHDGRDARGDPTNREIPGLLCRVAVGLLPVTGASMSLYSHGLPVRLGASNAQASCMGDLQATLGDGPCRSAVRARAPVLADDLTCPEDAGRWPVFAERATAAGVRAAYAIPLGDDAVCVGTLDLYRDTPGALTGGELDTARRLAALMTAALTTLGGLTDGHDDVHQATGMIMAQLGVSDGDALARLRGHAFAHDRTVVDVAREVVGRRMRFELEEAEEPE
ncbi:GAF and ANTAR domain-containing protein [Streptomyces sp. NPDC088794]|uniref:GAF and ANTAR domain-containing protein n=1 Tax=Streptomyces sp. NPDC088794 TaxID=3365902 RepID=UPI0038237A3D